MHLLSLPRGGADTRGRFYGQGYDWGAMKSKGRARRRWARHTDRESDLRETVG
jgi:hypothetical protein